MRPSLILYLLCAPVLYDSAERLAYVWGVAIEHGGWIEQRYLDHPAISTLHLLPGMVFFLTGPLQFEPALRRPGRATWHRLSGYAFAASALISATAVMALVWVFPAVGGALTVFGTYAICLALCLFAGLGLHAARRGNTARHRLMMAAAFSAGLTVATARWIIYAVQAVHDVRFDAAFAPASMVATAANFAVFAFVFRKEIRRELADS